MFYIRTDANSFVASGHVMRCLTIAMEIRKLGEQVTFITSDIQAKELILSKGFELICLDSKWDNLNLELNKLISIIREQNIEKLLIDSYYVTEFYLVELRKHVKLIYFDDLGKFPYPVDILINYNNYSSLFEYKKWANNHNTKLLLGCTYAPIREEFIGFKRIVPNNVKNILLTTGGSDSYHVAYKFIQYLINYYNNGCILNKENEGLMFDLKNINIHVVLGNFHPDKELLQKVVMKYPNIALHINVNYMSDLLRQTDIAISAGGFTMYELCACGIPMITYSFADNQILGVQGFHELGVAQYCGDVRDGEEALWNKIIDALKFYSANYELNCKIALKSQALVDGYGAYRIAKFII